MNGSDKNVPENQANQLFIPNFPLIFAQCSCVCVCICFFGERKFRSNFCLMCVKMSESNIVISFFLIWFLLSFGLFGLFYLISTVQKLSLAMQSFHLICEKTECAKKRDKKWKETTNHGRFQATECEQWQKMKEKVRSAKQQTVHFVICSSLKTSHTCFDHKHTHGSGVLGDVKRKMCWNQCVCVSGFFPKNFLFGAKVFQFSRNCSLSLWSLR